MPATFFFSLFLSGIERLLPHVTPGSYRALVSRAPTWSLGTHEGGHCADAAFCAGADAAPAQGSAGGWQERERVR